MVRKEELAHAALVCSGREAGSRTPMTLRRIVGLSRRCRIAPAALLVLATLAAQPTLSYADYPGHSNESKTTAYGPLALNTTYAASLQTANDSDYYYFYASAANQQIHVMFTNTSPENGRLGLSLVLEGEHEGVLDSVNVVGSEQTQELAYSVPTRGKYYLGVLPEIYEVPPVPYSFTISSPQPLLGSPHKPLTRAQKLAKALAQCKKLPRRSKRKSCEETARKKY
jgi:hypothetical protein